MKIVVFCFLDTPMRIVIEMTQFGILLGHPKEFGQWC